jgi:lipoprotein-releasing system permease protein
VTTDPEPEVFRLRARPSDEHARFAAPAAAERGPLYRLYLSFRLLAHHWLMTLIGSFFVGASLVILVVVMSVMDGFQEKLKDTIRGSSADVIVTPRYPVDLPALEAVLLDELGDRAEAAAPYYQTIALARKEGLVDRAVEETYHVAVVCGVDGIKEQRINHFGQYLLDAAGQNTERLRNDPFAVEDPLEKALGTVGVIVGHDLLREMRIKVGERLRFFSVTPKKGDGAESEDFELREGNFLVVATYKSSNSDLDRRWVFMAEGAFTDFFDAAASRPSVRVRLVDTDAFAEVRPLLHKALPEIVERSVQPGHRLRPGERTLALDSWRSENETLMRAIESEKSMILMIAFLIVVAGASSIFAAQWLLVTDKIREIGILRALGAGLWGIVSIFVLNGFLMGVLGAVGGALVGLWAVREIDALHDVVSWITGRDVFDPAIYLFEDIPTLVDYDQVTRYAVAALVCTLFASAIPALRAGLMDPAKALHRD